MHNDHAASRLSLDSLLVELSRLMRDIVGARDGLWRLIEAVVKVASAELSLSSVLTRVVEVAAEMVGAEYAALGVIGEDGGLREFVHTGIDDETVERIGHLPEGHGILGLLITDPQVLRLDDMAAHPASVGFPADHPPMRTFLGAPITVRGQVYGNLYLTNRRGGAFSDDDLELVTTLAAAAGVVIDNARLYDVALRRQRWLEATSDLTAALLGGSDAAQVHALVVQRARDLADAATCLLAIADREDVVVVAADGRHADELMGQRVPVAGSIAAPAYDSRRAVAVDVSALDVEHPLLSRLGDYGPALMVPMYVREDWMGVIIIARGKGREPFAAHDVRAAEDLATQAALALDYDHAQAQRRRAAVFTERERIGHDLHDLVIQRLFATGMRLDSISARIPDEVAGDEIRNAVDELDAAISDLRSSIFGLHARRRSGSTVTGQLEEICRNAEQSLGFAPECDIDRAVDTVPDEIVVDVLAAVRELLSNASRHADASRVTVRLHVAAGALRLDVADNGRGIPSSGRRSGLANLRARAEQFGGSMHIDSGPSGTRVSWRAPLQ